MSQPPTVAQLRQDVDDLVTAIAQAPETLQAALISQLGEAEHKLNMAVDPMARLPLELQSLIFLAVPPSRNTHPYPPHPPPPDPLSTPMVFLQVCQLWRDIALATPKLWCNVGMVDLPRSPNYSNLCGLWLSRARSLPVSLSLRGFLALNQDVQDMVAQYSSQLESLTLGLVVPDAILIDADTTLRLGHWRGLELSSLKNLSLQASDPASFGRISRWLDVLGAAPMLSTLELDNVFFEPENNQELFPSPLMLASLQYLELGFPFMYDVLGTNGSSSRILRHLTLPALRELSLSVLDVGYGELNAFISRSSPPLESLHMAIPFNWSLSSLVQFLRLIPTLVSLHLSITSPDPQDAAKLFLLFDTLNTIDFLPNLHTVEMVADLHVPVDYEQMLRLLTFRRTLCPGLLESFKLQIPEYGPGTPIPPSDHLKSGLRQLMEDGLSLHIGHPSANLL
ncbi:hypothetical protein R3P38DRAFT_3219303 [Favolaschia claudopus]|uniref:F-box domain-containing protein n=1 Tax=Favolaschia claudopus TaxID=2862362 RepID=A0AAW0A2N0_9AGAR